MPWNEPGKNNGNKDPWGNRNKQDGPPDLEELLKKIGGFFGGSNKGSGSSEAGGGKGMFVVAIVILSLLYGYMSFYKIDDQERAVVTRLGKYLRTDGPGAHFAFPPFDKYQVVNVTSLNETHVSGEMLTEDDNVVSVDVKLQYRIEKPKDYAFNVADPDRTLEHAAESALRQVIGHSRMEDVLTKKKEDIRQKVAADLDSILNAYGTGLKVVRVNLGNPELPTKVKPAYYDAIKAEEDELRYINEAQAYRNKETPLAEGTAERSIHDANAYYSRTVERAKGEIARFEQLLPQYEAAPEVTRERLYLDMMEQVLANSTKVMVDVEGGNNMIYLPLNEIMNRNSSSQKTSEEPNTSKNFGDVR